MFSVPVAAAAVTAFAVPAVENTAGEMKTESDRLVAGVVKKFEMSAADKPVGIMTPAERSEPSPPVTPDNGVKHDAAQENLVPDDDKIFDVVEVQPEYPGGVGELAKFLHDNITYPEVAFKAALEGRVIVQFVVRKDGSVGDATVVKGVSPELDAEALRIVGLMPKWKPGMVNGEPVNVRYTFPVTFRLETSAKQ